MDLTAMILKEILFLRNYYFIFYIHRFFKSINFNIERDNDERNKFFVHQLSHLISETNIIYDSLNIYDIELVAELLSKYSILN